MFISLDEIMKVGGMIIRIKEIVKNLFLCLVCLLLKKNGKGNNIFGYLCGPHSSVTGVIFRDC